MLRPLALGPLLIALLAGEATGQDCQTGSDRSKVDVAPDPIVFPVPTGADFAIGWIMSGTVTVRVNPRGVGREKPWVLCLAASDPDMGGYGKPVSDLEWQVEGSAGWVPIDQVNRLVQAGDGRSDVQMRFRANLFSDRDVPGTYSATLQFTARNL